MNGMTWLLNFNLMTLDMQMRFATHTTGTGGGGPRPSVPALNCPLTEVELGLNNLCSKNNHNSAKSGEIIGGCIIYRNV